jgi:hypothetical protein
MKKRMLNVQYLSNQFWKLLTFIVKVTEPIFNLMRFTDSGSTGKFYEYYDQSMEKVNEIDGLTLEKKKKLVTNDRCYFMHSSMHCAGIVLDLEW